MIGHVVVKLACRYLRTKWVVYLSVLAVAAALAGIIFVMSLQNWLVEMNKRSIRGTLSDIIVSTDHFTGFEGYEPLRQNIASLPQVQAVAVALEFQAVASTTGQVTPCKVIGIEIDRQQQVGTLRASVEAMPTWSDQQQKIVEKPLVWDDLEQAFRNPGIPAPALVGSELARSLGLGAFATEFIGWTATSFVTDNNQQLDAIGLVKSNSYDFDRSVVYIPLSVAQQFRDQPERASQLYVKLRDGADPAAAVQAIKALLDADEYAGLTVGTWQSRQAGFIDALDAERLVLHLLLLLFLVISAFSVTAIFWMIVLSKRRDIGIVRAMGTPVTGVAWSFIVFGLLVGVVAGGIGFAVGHGLVAYWEPFRLLVEGFCRNWLGLEVSLQLFDPSLYYLEGGSQLDVNLRRDLLLYGLTVLLCGAAGILPSILAARTNVIENVKG